MQDVKRQIFNQNTELTLSGFKPETIPTVGRKDQKGTIVASMQLKSDIDPVLCRYHY